MLTHSNYMFRPLTGHHQAVHSMKRVEGCAMYNVTLYIVQPPALFIGCTNLYRVEGCRV